MPTYSKLVYEDLWPWIALLYPGTGNRLKHEYVTEPGADSRQIHPAWEGVTGLEGTAAGEPRTVTPTGDTQVDAPAA